MKQGLWTKNFTLLIVATVLGGIGGIAGGFALSFLVFDETGSTFASALIMAVQFVPGVLIPIVASPYMDRLPRKPFLVGGDFVNGILFTLAGLYLMKMPFSYTGYLFFSLLLASLNSFDKLAYNSIYPMLIPQGFQQQGYAVSATVYPLLMVVMMPAAAFLMDTVGIAWILIFQGFLSILAALTESGIKMRETNRLRGERFSFRLWKEDILAACRYLRREKGLGYTYLYTGFSGGISNGYGAVMVAFFRSTPGFSAAMFSFFSVAECIGRSLGGLFHYRAKLPQDKKFGLCYFIYQFYAVMDMCILWLPYPLMLVNRAICGFLGNNSYSLREAAIQSYIPDEFRARVIAFSDILFFAMASVLSLLVGLMGELMDYRICMSLCGVISYVFCYLTIRLPEKHTARIFSVKNSEADRV